MARKAEESILLRNVGNSLRIARLNKGFSQEELADRAEISRNYYNSVENGHRNIALLNLVRIAVALEIESLNELVTMHDITTFKSSIA